MPPSPDPGTPDPGTPDPGRPDPAAHPENASRPRPRFTVALFVAVTWAAVVFAADGVIAVVTGRDPVPSGVDPYYGLVALAAAGVVVWLAVAIGAVARRPTLAALTGAAAVYLVVVASGLVGGVRLLTVQALSPFTVTAVVAAAIAVVATWSALRARGAGS